MHPVSLLAAALNFFGPIVPQDAQQCAAGWGSAIALLNNLIKFALSAAIIIAVLMIAYAGFLWVTNPINAENRTKARSVLMNAGIGLLIALGAWLIVNTLLGALSGGSSNIGSFTGFISGGDTCIQANNQAPGPSGGGLGGGNNGCPGSLVCSSSGTCGSDPQLDNGDGSAGAQCNASSPNCQNGLVCNDIGQCGTSATSGTTIPQSCTTQSTSTGTCQPASGGACDPSHFAAFGDQANQASAVCMGESSGNASVGSSGDKMRNDPQHRSFSWGLFQINITANTISGLNCPSAFNGRNYDATVKDEGLYAQCVAAAQDPNKNIAEALIIWNKDGQSFREWGAATKCGIALVNGQLFALAACIMNSYE